MIPACQPRGGVFRERHDVVRGECVACGQRVAEPTAVRLPPSDARPIVLGRWARLESEPRAMFDQREAQ